MSDKIAKLIEDLNHPDAGVRLETLRKLAAKADAGEIEIPVGGKDVNNHIHTTYSFSPYSPAKAVWMAYSAGLATAGIMDHDSIAGAEEFIKAGRIAGIATTVGVECRADFSKTPLNGRKINNPDQDSIAYIALHGIPRTQIGAVRDFFRPFMSLRNARNRKMTENINRLLSPAGIAIDFDRDVVPVSNYANGGSVTERHLLYALALRLIESFGKGEPLLSFLKNNLKLAVGVKAEGYLSDPSNPYYEYDLLGLLKSELVSDIYVNATDECPDITEILSFSDSVGAISAYAYLGDVGDSVTGDKKAQKFEDGYLDELFEILHGLGFKAVTYMPSRNSMAQLDRVRALCGNYGFFQISGEDINSPRQPFICTAMRNEKFTNLYDSAWALVGHEIAAAANPEDGMFTRHTIEKYPSLEQRISIYKEIGLRACPGMQG